MHGGVGDVVGVDAGEGVEVDVGVTVGRDVGVNVGVAVVAGPVMHRDRSFRIRVME